MFRTIKIAVALLMISSISNTFAAYTCPTAQGVNSLPLQYQTIICPPGKSFCLVGFTANNGLIRVGVVLNKGVQNEAQLIAKAKNMIQSITVSYRQFGHYVELFGGPTCFYKPFNSESAYVISNGAAPAVYLTDL